MKKIKFAKQLKAALFAMGMLLAVGLSSTTVKAAEFGDAPVIELNKTTRVFQEDDTNQYHYFKFTLPQSGTVTFSGDAIEKSSGRFASDLYNASETNIQRLAYQYGNDFPTQTYQLLAGTYYIDFYDYYCCCLDISIMFTPAKETYPESSMAKHNSMLTAAALNQNVTGFMTLEDSKDYFSYYVATAGILRLNYVTETFKNTNISVYKADGSVLTYFSNLGFGTNVNEFIVDKGTYYIEIDSDDNYGYYTLSASQKRLAVPAVKSLKKAKKGKKLGFTVKVNKPMNTIGWEVKYSLKKNMSQSKKKKYEYSAATKATIMGLKKNKTYYVMARSYYNTVDDKKVYSSWSTAKKVKLK